MVMRNLTEEDIIYIKNEKEQTKRAGFKLGVSFILLGLLLLIPALLFMNEPFKSEISLGSLGAIFLITGFFAIVLSITSSGLQTKVEGDVWTTTARLNSKTDNGEGTDCRIQLDDEQMPKIKIKEELYDKFEEGQLLYIEYHMPTDTILLIEARE